MNKYSKQKLNKRKQLSVSEAPKYFALGRVAKYCNDRVCVSVCPRAYLWNYTSDLHEIFVHVTYVAVARSSSGTVAIFYVFPVLRMASYL